MIPPSGRQNLGQASGVQERERQGPDSFAFSRSCFLPQLPSSSFLTVPSVAFAFVLSCCLPSCCYYSPCYSNLSLSSFLVFFFLLLSSSLSPSSSYCSSVYSCYSSCFSSAAAAPAAASSCSAALCRLLWEKARITKDRRPLLLLCCHEVVTYDLCNFLLALCVLHVSVHPKNGHQHCDVIRPANAADWPDLLDHTRSW